MLNLFILMDYSIHIDTISMELSTLFLRGCQSKFLLNDIHVLLSRKIVFILIICK